MIILAVEMKATETCRFCRLQISLHTVFSFYVKISIWKCCGRNPSSENIQRRLLGKVYMFAAPMGISILSQSLFLGELPGRICEKSKKPMLLPLLLTYQNWPVFFSLGPQQTFSESILLETLQRQGKLASQQSIGNFWCLVCCKFWLIFRIQKVLEVTLMFQTRFEKAEKIRAVAIPQMIVMKGMCFQMHPAFVSFLL